MKLWLKRFSIFDVSSRHTRQPLFANTSSTRLVSEVLLNPGPWLGSMLLCIVPDIIPASTSM